jgi:uncharacterized protein with beta-barrel porin domain
LICEEIRMRVVWGALLTLGCALVLAGAGNAQVLEELRKQSPEQIAQGQTDFWTRTLDLSPEQAAAFQQINLRYASNMRLAARLPGTDAQKVAPLASLEDGKTQEVLSLLTPAQRARYLEFAGNLQRARAQGESP